MVARPFYKPLRCPSTSDIMHPATEGKSLREIPLIHLVLTRVCIWFSFVTVNIDFPELYIEMDAHLSEANASVNADTVSDKSVWMRCKDLRHRCKWLPVHFDVSESIYHSTAEIYTFIIHFYSFFCILPTRIIRESQ